MPFFGDVGVFVGVAEYTQPMVFLKAKEAWEALAMRLCGPLGISP